MSHATRERGTFLRGGLDYGPFITSTLLSRRFEGDGRQEVPWRGTGKGEVCLRNANSGWGLPGHLAHKKSPPLGPEA